MMVWKKNFFILSLVLVYSVNYVSLSSATNKLVIDNFHWQSVETDHFNLYHYPAAQPVIPQVLECLRQSYDLVTQKLSYEPMEKVPFFLFLTHNDFEQNNIVDVDEGTGGVTEAFKYRFLLSYGGSYRQFLHVTAHEFTHVVQYFILLKGFMKSVRIIKGSLLNPLWLMEGMAEYTSGEFDATTREMYLRDAVLTHRLIPLMQLHNFSHLRPHQVVLAYKESESVIRYIAEEYGEDKVVQLLIELRNRLDIHSVLNALFGVDLPNFDRKWQEYLADKYTTEPVPYSSPRRDAVAVTSSISDIYEFNSDAVWSTDGSKIFFISDRSGSNEICSLDLSIRKVKVLVGLKQRNLVDYIYRGRNEGKNLTLSSDGVNICFIGKKDQRDCLYFYNLSTRKLTKREFNLEALSCPQYVPQGNQMVFSGMHDGVFDLFRYDISTGKLQQLTYTPNDDCHPTFSPDGNILVYASEVGLYYDLFSLNLSSGTITPLLSLSRDELAPVFSRDGKKIYFIADPDVRYDVYELDLTTRKVKRITQTGGGNFQPQISPDGSKLLYTSFYRGDKQIYLMYRDKNYFPSTELVKTDTTTAKTNIITFPETVLTSKPYRLNFSTDLFFPVLFYSSDAGLVTYLYWQASDMLGNHQLLTDLYYTDIAGRVEYNFQYSYNRWRTQLILAMAGNSNVLYSPFDENLYRIDRQNYAVQLKYPVDRFHSILTSFSTPYEKQVRFSDSQTSYYTGKILGLWFLRDTVQSKYLNIPLSGEIIQLGLQSEHPVWGAGRELVNLYLILAKYVPVWYKHNLKVSLQTVHSTGRNRSGFNLYLRGWDLGYQEIWPNLFTGSLEYHLPLTTKLNYHMWYMLPDFFFKYFGLVGFYDTVIGWDEQQPTLRRSYRSVGLGLRFYAFILQYLPFTIGIDWIKRVDTDFSRGEFVFTIGYQ